VITAYLSVALLVVYYIYYFDPNADPFRSSSDGTTKTAHPNPVDCLLFSVFQRAKVLMFRRSGTGHKGERLESAVNKVSGPLLPFRLRVPNVELQCIVMFADIQIITGVAILVSGYVSLRCGLSTYHWELVVDLAWFSSVTHLSTLTFLRHYLHNRPKQKRLRVMAMLVLLVLLCVAVGPTAHFAWRHETDAGKLALLKVQSSSHTICVYKLSIDKASPALHSMVVTICLLVYGFTMRIVKLSPRSGNRLRIWGSELKKRSIRMKARWEPDVGGSKATVWRTMVVEPLYIAGLQFLHVQLDLFCSVFAEVSLPH
jgi:hypothetical protein